MNQYENIKGIKDDCIGRITEIINEQLLLMGSAKAETVKYDIFKEQFNKLENEKEVLISINEDCKLILETFICIF